MGITGGIWSKADNNSITLVSRGGYYSITGAVANVVLVWNVGVYYKGSWKYLLRVKEKTANTEVFISVLKSERFDYKEQG